MAQPFQRLGLQCFCMAYHVDAVKGSDITGTGVEKNPWQTITYALSQSDGTDGDPFVIHVSPGIYDSSIGEIFPLKMKSFTNISGKDRKTTIIDCTGFDETVIYCKSAVNLVIKSLTLTGGKGHLGIPG